MVVATKTLELQPQTFDWGFAEAQFTQQPTDIISEADKFRLPSCSTDNLSHALPQSPDAPDLSRSPKSEIYGRSLGTIRRFGAFMISKAVSEIITSPEAAQAKAEFFTSVEEGFGTDMELGGGLEVRDFDPRPVINGRVTAKDLKTAISSMTEAGLTCAEETAIKDTRFLPQLTRSKWDHENALLVDKMARGETDYNTRIVISPFPEEGAAQSGDAYWRNIGYVPHLKRGFVQLYHVTEKGGAILAGSLSFDGSNKQRLREIFSQRDIEIPKGEITDNWLKYALTGNLSKDEAKALATEIADSAGDPKYKKNTNTVDVTKQYKPIMDRAFNESYIHICESLARGRQTDEAQDLIHQLADNGHYFNERYSSALYRMRANREQFTGDDSIVLHELLVYSTIEMMRAFHLQKALHNNPAYNNRDNIHVEPMHLQAANPSLFQNMLSGFGADGARNNRTYSACGLSISLGDNDLFSLSESNLFSLESRPQTVFGGVDNNESSLGQQDAGDGKGPLIFKCTEGHVNVRKKGELLTACQSRTCKKGSVGCDKDPIKEVASKEKRTTIMAPWLGRHAKVPKVEGLKTLQKPDKPLKIQKSSAFALAG